MRNIGRRNQTVSAVTTSPAFEGETPLVLTPANPPTAVDVSNSIANWAKDVNTVNAFLNDATLSGAPLALTFAVDEPVQLKTLSSTTGLSTSGQQAADTLSANFPSIPTNLNDTIQGTMSLNTATTNINFDRCCTVLPAINTLWQEAASASGADTPDAIQFEDVCVDINCGAGASN